MKRKHKRQLDGVLRTVKTIVFGGLIFVGLVVVLKTIKNGELEMKSIYNTFSSNTIKKSDTLYVVGDNTVSGSQLLRTKQIIESYFGLNVKISERITLDTDLIDNNGYLMGGQTLDRYDDENDKIIITNLYCKDDNHNIGGISQGESGNILLVGKSSVNINRLFEETIIHEISHNFGLDHCDNGKCIMFWMGSHLGKHDMCDDCRKKLSEKLD